jgi:hypothetical protein
MQPPTCPALAPLQPPNLERGRARRQRTRFASGCEPGLAVVGVVEKDELREPGAGLRGLPLPSRAEATSSQSGYREASAREGCEHVAPAVEDWRLPPATPRPSDTRANANAGLGTSDGERPPTRQSRDHPSGGSQVTLAGRRAGRALARTRVPGQPRRRPSGGACWTAVSRTAGKHRDTARAAKGVVTSGAGRRALRHVLSSWGWLLLTRGAIALDPGRARWGGGGPCRAPPRCAKR